MTSTDYVCYAFIKDMLTRKYMYATHHWFGASPEAPVDSVVKRVCGQDYAGARIYNVRGLSAYVLGSCPVLMLSR